MESFTEEQIISQRNIPGITPDFILSEIEAQPLMYQHYRINTAEHKQRFIEVMMRAPSHTDKPGFIYGFRNKEGYDAKAPHYEIKLGRTSREVPQDRIFQWQRDDKHQYLQIFTARSQHNVKLEALVHLLFAYARKTLIINGKRRIEWFEFQQKIPTAAITNLINLLMQKVHQRNFQSICIDPIEMKNYDNLIAKIVSGGYTFNKENRRFIAFGLPRTGKTTVGTILLDGQICAEKVGEKIKIISKLGSNNSEKLVQISTISQTQNQHIFSTLQKYFVNWHLICNTQKIIPLLVVRQSDIESSMQAGLFEGIKIMKQYLKINRTPLVIVNHANLNFNEVTARQTFAQAKQFINNDDWKALESLQLLFLKKVGQIGKYPLDSEKKQICTGVQTWGLNENWGSVLLKIDKELLKECHQIIQAFYPILQQIYSDKFTKKIKLVIEEKDKIDMFKFVRERIKILHDDDCTAQQIIHENIRRLNKFLDLQEQQNIQSFLYTFCECLTNSNLNHSLIFDTITEKVNAKETQIVGIQNRALDECIQMFKVRLQNYIKQGNTKYLNIFKEILAIDALDITMGKLQYIVQENLINDFDKKMVIDIDSDTVEISGIVETKQLVQSIQTLLSLLRKLQNYQSMGLRFNNALVRIKQSIFLALKSEVEVRKSPVQKISHQKMKNEQKIQKKSTSKEPKDSIFFTRYNKLSEIMTQLNNISQGKTLMNQCKGQFIFDQKFINLKINIILMARSIKVFNELQISFAKIEEGKPKRQFTILSEKWQNYQKIKIPETSKNGKVCVLTVIDDNLFALDPYHAKNADKIKTIFYQGLLDIYNKNVK